MHTFLLYSTLLLVSYYTVQSQKSESRCECVSLCVRDTSLASIDLASASLEDPHRHRHCSATYRAVTLHEPLAARPAYALVAARGEDVSLGLIQAHDARLAVGILHLTTHRALLGSLVD